MRICDREGCDRKHYAKGLCASHYSSQLQCAKWKNDPEYRARRKQYQKEDWAGRRASQRRAYIKNNYGMSIEEYDALMAQPCGLCGGKAEALDHDHLTGELRGPLCRRCNTGLVAELDNATTEELFRGLLWTRKMEFL